MYTTGYGTLVEEDKKGKRIYRQRKGKNIEENNAHFFENHPPSKKAGQFIDPLSDYGWKKLFNCQECRGSLLALLGALLDKEFDFDDLSFDDGNIMGSNQTKREARHDASCSYTDE